MVVAFLICFALRQGTSKDAIELIWCLQSMPLGILPPLRGLFFFLMTLPWKKVNFHSQVVKCQLSKACKHLRRFSVGGFSR